MAYFKNIKLDPNFEDWLDSKIIKLKAEGVLESDPEDYDSSEDDVVGVPLQHPYTQLNGSLQGGVLGSGSDSEHEYAWGEDPIGEPDVSAPPLPGAELGVGSVGGGVSTSTYTGEEYYHGMATLSSGGKIRLVEDDGGGGEPVPKSKHISSAVGGDYYQFTWEEDEEADIFDREEYQLGHTNEHIPGPVRPHRTGPHQHIETDVRIANGTTDNSERASTGENTVLYRLTGSNNGARPNNGSPRAGGLSGLVLGVGRQDVEVAYTKLQGVPRRNRNRNTYSDDPASQRQFEKDWEFEIHDTENRPDPRFSIGDEHDGPNDVPMLEFGRREDGHGRSARVTDPGSGSGAAPGAFAPEGDRVAAGTKEPLQEDPGGGTTYGNGRILLPMDTMEMTMTSDDDDDDVIDGDAGSELSPDTVPIVTVDQATLVEQWRSKSARTRWGIVLGLVGGALLLFGLVTFLIVHILTSTWHG